MAFARSRTEDGACREPERPSPLAALLRSVTAPARTALRAAGVEIPERATPAGEWTVTSRAAQNNVWIHISVEERR